MIDKENKKTWGEKTHEGKILIYCGGNILLLRRWCHVSCVATYSSSSCGLVLRHTPPPPPVLVSHVLCCDILLLLRRLLLRRTPPPPAVLCCDILLLLLRHWFHASCVATYPSSSGVGVTRLVLRRTPPPPALVSRVWCCDVPLLLRRWFHVSGVATYPFSHVKSTRLLPLAGNPRHETQDIRRIYIYIYVVSKYVALYDT